MLDLSSEDFAYQDALSQVLQDLRPVGVSYGHCRLTRPWGVHISAESVTRLHVAVSGKGWLLTKGSEPIRLEAGDAAFLPQGVAHAMADTPGRRTRPLSALPRERIGHRIFRMTSGGGGSATLMACCAVRFEQPAVHPLLGLMPPIMLIRRATLKDPTLPVLLDAMADEVMAERLGSATVLARLADVVIVRLIRRWAEEQPKPTAWLAALRDRRIGRAIAAIHREPGRAWSLHELALVASVSRSVFSERFTQLTGIPPARYLARLRMILASGWLRNGRISVATAAERLGYGSEAAFSRAYKRIIGARPSEIRQRFRRQ